MRTPRTWTRALIALLTTGLLVVAPPAWAAKGGRPKTSEPTAPTLVPTSLWAWSFTPAVEIRPQPICLSWFLCPHVPLPHRLDGAALRATLWADGAPLGGKLITFSTAAGTALCQATTDAYGDATCIPDPRAVPAAAVDGRYVATFAGDETYAASTSSAGFLR